MGKHTNEAIKIKELENVIALRDKEIQDIKTECAEQFEKIKNLCFINNYTDKFANIKKIFEIATDNFKALVVDVDITNDEENAKIIELAQTSNQN